MRLLHILFDYLDQSFLPHNAAIPNLPQSKGWYPITASSCFTYSLVSLMCWDRWIVLTNTWLLWTNKV